MVGDCRQSERLVIIIVVVVVVVIVVIVDPGQPELICRVKSKAGVEAKVDRGLFATSILEFSCAARNAPIEGNIEVHLRGR